jgi:pyruvate/2-oxoglutarate dehydrogenase complex dihydrolipoamide acyltransferase (E2) component
VALGAVNEKACVVDHKIEIREIITVGITADHRYTDGARAMRLLSKFNAYIHDPEKYLSDKESVYNFVPKWKA